MHNRSSSSVSPFAASEPIRAATAELVIAQARTSVVENHLRRGGFCVRLCIDRVELFDLHSDEMFTGPNVVIEMQLFQVFIGITAHMFLAVSIVGWHSTIEWESGGQTSFERRSTVLITPSNA